MIVAVKNWRRPKVYIGLILLTGAAALLPGAIHNLFGLSSHSGDFELSFRAIMLEPGRKTAAPPNSEIEISSITWTSPTDARTVAALWNSRADIKFDSPDQKSINNLVIVSGTSERREKIWDVWRHRHGFILSPSQGYCWLSTGDFREPMELKSAEFFDRTLRETWGYWAAKGLTERLRDPAVYPVLPKNEDDYNFKKSYTLNYNARGLVATQPINFQINLWRLPVKVQFDVQTSTRPGGPLVEVVGSYRWTYSTVEWRRLHGYEKNFWGGYTWLPGFPNEQKLTEQQGFLLDQMLDRSIAYWVEVTMELLRADLEIQLKARIEDL